jgi:uncharacterized glyoxalase superfamily protein PhnB
MSSRPAGSATIIPTMRYRDAPAAIDFLCRDPEGHLWSFGTYDPWAPRGGGA